MREVCTLAIRITKVQFRQIIEQKSEDLKLQNEAACQEFASQMLMQLFSELEQVKQAIVEDASQDAF